MSEVDFRHSILPPSASMRKAIEVMTSADGAGIVLVVGKDRKLSGVVVDSDIRKAILKGHGLRAPLAKVMNARPYTLPFGTSRDAIARSLRAEPRANVPLVDGQGRVRGLARMVDYLADPKRRDNWVVLLVGGLGRRLGPLTKDRPKPLLPVGNKPILETIVEQFVAAGFKRFAFAVNHHADQILQYFGNGRKMGVDIRYLHEKKRLGTAGPLSLLPKNIKEPLLVMNGDLLTKVDFGALLDFHREEGGLATLCVREYDFQVPFGVVQMNDHRLERIVEKPLHRFYVNAGIYALDPAALKMLKPNTPCDMPDFLERIRRSKRGSVSCFPIREYWIDIGRVEEYKRAQDEFGKFF